MPTPATITMRIDISCRTPVHRADDAEQGDDRVGRTHGLYRQPVVLYLELVAAPDHRVRALEAQAHGGETELFLRAVLVLGHVVARRLGDGLVFLLVPTALVAPLLLPVGGLLVAADLIEGLDRDEDGAVRRRSGRAHDAHDFPLLFVDVVAVRRG